MGVTLAKRPPQRKPCGQHPDKALTTAFVRKLNRAGRYCDGQVLYLDVRPTGSRGWVQRLVIRGRRPELGLWGFHLVSLKEASEKAFANLKLAREGGDPLSEKRRVESAPPSQKRPGRSGSDSSRVGAPVSMHSSGQGVDSSVVRRISDWAKPERAASRKS